MGVFMKDKKDLVVADAVISAICWSIAEATGCNKPTRTKYAISQIVIMIIAALIVMTCVSCANPHKAEYIDTTIEQKSKVSFDQYIGVKDGNMIVQKKVLMSEELRLLQNSTHELEAKVYGGPRYFDNNGLHGVLRQCYFKTAETDGQIKLPEKREYVIPEMEYTSMGLDEQDKIVGLSEEYLKDRIKRFLSYKKILTEREQEYEDKISICNFKLTQF